MSKIITEKICLLDGCIIRSTRRSGYCSKHHYRFERYGDASIVHKVLSGCEVNGCGSPHHANGYCGMHNARFSKYGDANFVKVKRDNSAGHKLRSTYNGMIARCYNSKNPSYHRYGGKGVMVCERWRESFWDFVEDMGERPEGHTIDRIDGNGNYEPSNCRWATIHEQNANLSSNNKYVGVCWHKGGKRWVAYMNIDGKRFNLGGYKSEREAYLARKRFEARE